MGSLSDDDILDAVAYNMRTNRQYRDDLVNAIDTKNHSWMNTLIRRALGFVREVGKAVLSVIVGWFIPKPW
ncbi:hypothetical protein [Cryptosporangium minutisporangium]|uniref:Uncharacterized protein n=1 Tax=Cryptosporangium minutisporangium TaxID=113569 RepID=A0ABP6SZB2_9ACTN